MLLAYKLYITSIKGVKDVTRVEIQTKNPLTNFFDESNSGASTIRAYEKVDGFIEKNTELLNKNILANLWSQSVPLWLAVRVDLISVFMMLTVSVICVMYRTDENAILLSLLLFYVMTL